MDLTLAILLVRRGEVSASLADRPGIPRPAGLMIPRWRVESVLCARLEELGGHGEFGHRPETLEQRADGVLADVATTGARATLSAPWVGGGNGHIRMRVQAGIAFPWETREDVRMVAVQSPCGQVRARVLADLGHRDSRLLRERSQKIFSSAEARGPGS